MTDSGIDRDSRRNFAPRHDFSFLFVISQILPQGKFWAYHDLLYANAPKAGPDHLKAFAQEVGLNLPAFEQCVSSRKYRAAVQKDVDDGHGLGVTGTPTFFINGRLLSGAQPFESFARMIDEELERQR